MGVRKLQAVARRSTVDRDLPRNVGLELEIEHETAVLKEEAGRVALRDMQVTAVGVEADLWLGPRVADVGAIQVCAGVGSLHRDVCGANIDLHARLLDLP